VKVYPSPEIIPGLDTVLVGEVKEHALAVPHMMPLTFPFLVRECGYSDVI